MVDLGMVRFVDISNRNVDFSPHVDTPAIQQTRPT